MYIRFCILHFTHYKFFPAFVLVMTACLYRGMVDYFVVSMSIMVESKGK